MTRSLPAVHNPLGPRPVAVRPRTLAALADHLGTALPEGTDPSTELTGITHDSRDVRSADAYAALPGARCHGADFAAAAVAAGARAVVTDPAGAARCAGTGVPVLVVADPRRRLGELAAWIYGEPAIALTLIGVTGTNGKTTTSHLVEAGLRAAGRRTGLSAPSRPASATSGWRACTPHPRPPSCTRCSRSCGSARSTPP